MKFVISIFIIMLMAGCSYKPKTVLICGDHICVNKTEAKQFFEENLSIEVKIVDKKIEKNINLVELNLKENNTGKKMIKITSKKNTKENLKDLTKVEKKIIRQKVKEKKLSKKNNKDNKKKPLKVKKASNKKIVKVNDRKFIKKDVDSKEINVADVCTIIENCNIEEISRYLLKQGKIKNYPDITKRQ